MRWWRIGCVGLTSLLASCAGPSETDFAALDDAAQEFFNMQLDGDDELIFETAASEFRQNGTLESVRRINDLVRSLDSCGRRIPMPDYNWNRTLTGFYVSRSYRSVCDGDDLFESFTFRIDGDEAKLVGYNVAGMALFPQSPGKAEDKAPETP